MQTIYLASGLLLSTFSEDIHFQKVLKEPFGFINSFLSNMSTENAQCSITGQSKPIEILTKETKLYTAIQQSKVSGTYSNSIPLTNL